MFKLAKAHAHRPDARVRWLAAWIRENMAPSGKWNERRLVLFTEYEDTRRWLEKRGHSVFPFGAHLIATLIRGPAVLREWLAVSRERPRYGGRAGRTTTPRRPRADRGSPRRVADHASADGGDRQRARRDPVGP